MKNRGSRFFKVVLSLLLVVGSVGILASSHSPAFAKTKISDKKEYVVYITRTGKKYHRAGCRYLRQSSYEISKSDAIQQGYSPCKVCRP